MSRRRSRYIAPFEVEILRIGKGGVGVGEAPDGAPVHVRFTPPGARVLVIPAGKRKGTWSARRERLIRPPADGVTPRCDRFGLCGGCQLQELALPTQTAHRHAAALRDIGAHVSLDGVTVHPPRATPSAYGYRNKVELTFGRSRFLSETDHADGHPIRGRFLGFHAPGRFDRVVDAPRCELVPEPLNEVITATRRLLLTPDTPEIYDAVGHTGFLRHLLLRHGAATGEVLVVLYTAAPTCPEETAAAHAWGDAIAALPLSEGRIVSVSWAVNTGVADVARGEMQRTWGGDRYEDRLHDVRFSLSATSFFQTNTAGAEILYDTVGEALGDATGTLVDLYCGTGAIGLVLAHRFDRVIGVESREEAVLDARANATASGVDATFTAAKVEHVIADLPVDDVAIVVDPPRVGLYPSVTKRLADSAASHLVYVACKPSSLGRDAALLAEGGWHLDALWTVDLFPHTGHIEAVATFKRLTAG